VTGIDRLDTLRSGLMVVVSVAAIALIFGHADWITSIGGMALVAFLILGWRRFTVGTWVPIGLAAITLTVALVERVPGAVLAQGIDRALFLAALMSLLGMLRSAAMIAPEVEAAGKFVTGQPASRRYLALSFGGHLFGVLINFGGLIILLDLARNSLASAATRSLSPALQEVRLRRMTLAVMRGFTLISLWSPFGFATNVILITLPSLSYADFGPIGFAASFIFVAVGWTLDRLGHRHLAGAVPRGSTAPDGSWRGAVLLLGHVAALGGAIFVLYRLSPLNFQEALILLVPGYAVLWAALSARGAGTGRMVARALGDTWKRMPLAAGEIGMFAAAGFLSVVLLAVIPVEGLRAVLADAGLGATGLIFGLALGIVALALMGVNPIVASSVLGAIAVQLALPGVSDLGIALAITGGWTVAIGLSPFLTTSILCAAITERPAWRIGPIWNGPYSATILLGWGLFLGLLMLVGVI